MNVVRLLVFFLILSSFSCGKDEPEVVDPPDKVLEPVFQMEIDGKLWEAGIYYYKIENEIPKIFATDNVYTIHWQIDGTLKEKSYVLGKFETEILSSFYKFEDGKNLSYNLLSGTLKIDTFDIVDKILTGTFNLIAEHEGVNLAITNGKFVIKDF